MNWNDNGLQLLVNLQFTADPDYSHISIAEKILTFYQHF